MDNFDDEEIKRQAKEKLKFEPLSQSERQMLEEVAKCSQNEELVARSKAVLKEGGRYSVYFPEFLSGANISVGITKEFMAAVKGNKEYELRFPDIVAMTPGQKAFYDKE